VDPATDELKIEIVDLLRLHAARTDDELVNGTGMRSFNYLRRTVRALESDGTIVKSGDVWMLAERTP
jgi:transcription initiation factor IIE alpha subunit